jgi:pheromone shutdown-related protein TraB
VDTNPTEASSPPSSASALPPLPDSVTEIVHEGTTYYIVGTAHVSARSVEDVKVVIDRVKPDVVCVELDKVRFEALTKDSAFRDLDVLKVVREGRTLYLLAHLALAAYQKRIGASLGVKPGAELLAAVEAAKERGIPVELIDRDINITLKRTWKNLGLWKRTMLFSSLIFGFDEGDEESEPITEASVEGLKKPEELSELMTELGRAVPQIKTPLIDERDQYLSSRAVEVGKGKQRVVAVVGAAHVPGMKENFGKPVDRAALEKIPPPSVVWKVIKWLIPALFLVGLFLLWQRSDYTNLLEVMLAWIIPTSVGAATFTLLAGGSPFSIATALVVAPLASIHPLVRTGVMVGIVETWRRKPGVQDCERLPEDIQSFRGFWRNQVTRILLVAIAAGIGKWIGFWVGVSMVASRL